MKDVQLEGLPRSRDDLSGTEWGILPGRLAEACETLVRATNLLATGQHVTASDDGLSQSIEVLPGSRYGRDRDDPYGTMVERRGGTTLVKVHGTMVSFDLPQWLCEYLGLCVTARVQSAVREADEDSRCERIVLDIDSPGGLVGGVSELADAIAACETPVHAQAADLCASAAYWMASSADTLTCTDTSRMGSVGVLIVAARVKPERAWTERLTIVSSQTPRKAMDLWHADDDKRTQARADVQKVVDDLAAVFIEHVTAQRGDHGGKLDGRVFVGQDAVDTGYADSVSTLANVMKPESQPEDMMEGNAAETARAEGVAHEKERIDAINALPGPADLKLKAITEGMTAMEAATMMLTAKSEAEAAGETYQNGQSAHEADTEHPEPGAGAGDGGDDTAAEAAAVVNLFTRHGRAKATIMSNGVGG